MTQQGSARSITFSGKIMSMSTQLHSKVFDQTLKRTTDNAYTANIVHQITPCLSLLLTAYPVI